MQISRPNGTKSLTEASGERSTLLWRKQALLFRAIFKQPGMKNIYELRPVGHIVQLALGFSADLLER